MVKRLFGTLIRALGQRPKYFSECPFQSFKKVFTSAYLLLNQPQTSTIFFAAFSFTLSHIALQSIFYFRWGSNQRTLMKQDKVQTLLLGHSTLHLNLMVPGSNQYQDNFSNFPVNIHYNFLQL